MLTALYIPSVRINFKRISHLLDETFFILFPLAILPLFLPNCTFGRILWFRYILVALLIPLFFIWVYSNFMVFYYNPSFSWKDLDNQLLRKFVCSWIYFSIIIITLLVNWVLPFIITHYNIRTNFSDHMQVFIGWNVLYALLFFLFCFKVKGYFHQLYIFLSLSCFSSFRYLYSSNFYQTKFMMCLCVVITSRCFALYSAEQEITSTLIYYLTIVDGSNIHKVDDISLDVNTHVLDHSMTV